MEVLFGVKLACVHCVFVSLTMDIHDANEGVKFFLLLCIRYVSLHRSFSHLKLFTGCIIFSTRSHMTDMHNMFRRL